MRTEPLPVHAAAHDQVAQRLYKGRKAAEPLRADDREQTLDGSVVLRFVNRASDLLFAMARFTDVPDPELFEEMIRAGGGRPVAVHAGTDIHGEPNGIYYQLSEWPGVSGSPDSRTRKDSRRPIRSAGCRERESRLRS